MGLHRVLADEQLLGDLAVAHTGGYMLQDLQLPRRDPELLQSRGVGNERSGGRSHRNLSHDYTLAATSDSEPEPNPKTREEERHQPTVDLDGMLHDEVAVLDQLETRYEDAAEEAVDENGFPHGVKIVPTYPTPLGLSA